MKKSSKKLLLSTLALVFALFVAIAPMAVFAYDLTVDSTEGGYIDTSTTVAYVSADGVSIALEDGNGTNAVTYALTVNMSGASASSFEMSVRMPDFTDVTNVRASEALEYMSETAIFEWYTDEETGYVNIAYSGPVDFTDTELFTVEFTVNNYVEQYSAVECVKSRFVNSNVETVRTNVDLGTIGIGAAQINVMGDVNGDRIVNLADLLIIQRSIVNPRYMLTAEQFLVADIDKDGNVNIVDCQYIQNFLVGKIPSLEMTQATGVTVRISDQNGKTMYAVVHSVENGVMYAEFISPVFEMLSQEYNILRTLSITSSVYGQIPVDATGEGYVVTGTDIVSIVVEVEYSQATEPQYSLTHESGTETEWVVARYDFYEGGRLVVSMNVNGVDAGTETYKWWHNGQYIAIDNGEEVISEAFIINSDGSISVNDGSTSDKDVYIERTILPGSDMGYAITAGDDLEMYLSRVLVGQSLEVYMSDGTVYNITVTREMIDTSSISPDLAGEYEIVVNFNTPMGHSGSIYNMFNVLPNMEDVEVVASYTFLYDGYEEGGFNTVVLYANGVAIIDGAQQAQWYASEGDATRIELLVDGMVRIITTVDNEAGTMELYQPPESEHIVTYTYSMGQGMNMQFFVYGDASMGAGEYVIFLVQNMMDENGEMQTAYMTTYATVDFEARTFYCDIFGREFTINDDNTLTLKECEHAWNYETREPTCTEYGEQRQWCDKCGLGNSGMIAPLGHSIVNGYCERCGISEDDIGDVEIPTDLEMYKQNVLNSIEVEWKELINKYGDLSQYTEQFDKYYTAIANASSYDDVNYYQDMYRQLVERIHSSSQPSDSIVSAESDVEAIGITLGTSYEELLSKIVGKTVVITRQQSGTTVYSINEDNIEFDSSLINNEGVYQMHVCIAMNDGSAFDFSIEVLVYPAPAEGVVNLGSYAISHPYVEEMGFNTIILYSDGSAFLTGGSLMDIPTSYQFIGDVEAQDTISIMIDGGALVFELSESGIATFYEPLAGESAIGQYTYDSGYMSAAIAVYGEYVGAGEYISTMTVCGQTVDGVMMEMTIATLVYIDMENGYLTHVMFNGAEMLFDENGVLTPKPCEHTNVGTDSNSGDCYNSGYVRTYCRDCGMELSYEMTSPAGHVFNADGMCERCGMMQGSSSEELHAYMNQKISEMMNIWKTDIIPNYTVTEEQNSRFNEYTAKLKEAQSIEEVDAVYEMFKMFCEEIRMNGGNTNVGLSRWAFSTDTYEATVGTDMETFTSNLLNDVRFVLYYTNGTFEEFVLDASMLDFSETDLSVVGTCSVRYNFSSDMISGSFSLQINVTPNMEEANLTGSYTYAGEGTNGGGWSCVDMYDNGYAILYAIENDRTMYVEYQLSEMGEFIYTMYGVRFVYSVNFETNTMSMYTSDEIIGVYSFAEGQENGSITVYGYYNGAGWYFAAISESYTSSDGMTETDSATVEVYFDMENKYIESEMFGGKIYFDDDGNLIISNGGDSEGDNVEEVIPPVVENGTITNNGDYTYDATYNDTANANG